jgi:hypothetical protein
VKSSIPVVSNIKKQKKYICIKCNKEYNNKTSKYKHQKKCLNKKDIYDIKIKNLEDELQKLKTLYDEENNNKLENNFKTI